LYTQTPEDWTEDTLEASVALGPGCDLAWGATDLDCLRELEVDIVSKKGFVLFDLVLAHKNSRTFYIVRDEDKKVKVNDCFMTHNSINMESIVTILVIRAWPHHAEGLTVAFEFFGTSSASFHVIQKKTLTIFFVSQSKVQREQHVRQRLRRRRFEF
jgi:hypothetical protein